MTVVGFESWDSKIWGIFGFLGIRGFLKFGDFGEFWDFWNLGILKEPRLSIVDAGHLCRVLFEACAFSHVHSSEFHALLAGRAARD